MAGKFKFGETGDGVGPTTIDQVGACTIRTFYVGSVLCWVIRGPMMRCNPGEKERLAHALRSRLRDEHQKVVTHEAVYKLLWEPDRGGKARDDRMYYDSGMNKDSVCEGIIDIYKMPGKRERG